MSSLRMGSTSNAGPPSRRLDANRATKHHGVATRAPTKQNRPASLYELPLSANVLRATRNNIHTCAIHGRRRTSLPDPSTPTVPLTSPTHVYGPPIPPGVVRATSIGLSRATYMSQRPTRESLEEAFYDCQEASVGFLTPSLNQSHSELPNRGDDDPTEDVTRLLCCYFPKMHLPRLQLIPCLRVSSVKGEPKVVGASSHASRAELPPKVRSKKSAYVANDVAIRSVGNTNPVRTKLASYRSLVRAVKVRSLSHSDSTITACRNSLFRRGRRTGPVFETATKRNYPGNIRHQTELPTIVTLRRAIAVLNTLIEPCIDGFSADMNNSAVLREYRRSIRSMAFPNDYLITSEEIRSLKSRMENRFISPVSKQTALVKKKSSGRLGWNGRVRKSRSGSVVWFGASGRDLQPRAALSISNAHTTSGSILSRGRKGYLMSHVAQQTSIISKLMAGRSIHEIVWEDDREPQNIFFSTWSLAANLVQVDLATCSRNSHRRNPSPASIKYKAPYSGGAAIMGIKRTFKTAWGHAFDKASDMPYNINKSLSLSEVNIPSYVTQPFSICTPKPLSDGVWLPPIFSFKTPLIEIPTTNLLSSALDPSPTDSIWKNRHVTLDPQPKLASLGNPVANASEKLDLAALVTMSQSKPSLWGQSIQSMARIPVDSGPKPSLRGSPSKGRGIEPTTENTPGLQNALGIGSGKSWQHVAGVEIIKDAEMAVENLDSRVPWGAEVSDGVSIISDDAKSDVSRTRDATPRKRKTRLLRKVSHKAGHARYRLIAVQEQKAMKGSESIKWKDQVAESDCTHEKRVVLRGTLREKSKYDELEEMVTSLGALTPILRPRSSGNCTKVYGSTRAIDWKIGNDRPLKVEGGSRRSVTTIV